MPGPLVTDPLVVADWRRHVAEAYADVRRIAADDPAGAHAVWVQRRDVLLAEHPASPLDAATRASFAGLDVAPYDPAFRFEVDVRPATNQRLDVTTGTDGVVTFERIGSVELPGLGALALWSVRGYAGGLFLPVRDALAGRPGGTYGGGRYVLDTVKGADLGTRGGRLVVDLNFAYNPSCAYAPEWACPLATRANTLTTDVPVGERTWVARAWDDGAQGDAVHGDTVRDDEVQDGAVQDDTVHADDGTRGAGVPSPSGGPDPDPDAAPGRKPGKAARKADRPKKPHKHP